MANETVTSAIPMPQDEQNPAPVVNIPASAVPPGMANAPHPSQNQMTTLKINGENVVVTQEQLVAMAQKGEAANESFQAAAAKVKEAETAMAMQEDMKLLTDTGDINAFRRLGASLGLSGDKVEEAATLVFEGMGEGSDQDEGGLDENDVWRADDQKPGRGPSTNDFARELAEIKAKLDSPTGFDNLSPDLQDVLTDTEQNRIDRIVQSALDNNEFFAYYLKSYDTKGQEAIRGMIDDEIRGRLNDSPDGRFGDGTQILNDVLPKVQSVVQAIGIPERSTPPMGLGPAPGGQGSNVYPTKAPDHVSSTEASFEEHITEVMAHNIRQGAG